MIPTLTTQTRVQRVRADSTINQKRFQIWKQSCYWYATTLCSKRCLVLHNNYQDMGKELMTQQHVGEELQAYQWAQFFFPLGHVVVWPSNNMLPWQSPSPEWTTGTWMQHGPQTSAAAKFKAILTNDICQSTIPLLPCRWCLHRMIILIHTV
jgi:hypothetical protein